MGEDVEVVLVEGEEQSRAWQQFRLAGLPDMIGAVSVCYVLTALEQAGVLDRLRDGGGTADELLVGSDERLGCGLLTFLSMNDILFTHQGRYVLTERGTAMTGPAAMARLGVYLEAYGSVIASVPALLDGTRSYGRDVLRDGAALGKHCATLFSVFHSPTVLSVPGLATAASLLDLGCGGGSLVVDACVANPDLIAFGIDESAGAISEARALAKQSGVEDRATFFEADAFEPSTWPADVTEVDVVCAVSVMHEQFREGEGAVVQTLDRLAGVFPARTRLLLGEPELLYDGVDNDDDFYLVHVLSNQGLPRDRDDWLAVLGRSRWRCEKIYTRTDAGPRICFFSCVGREDRATDRSETAGPQ